MDKLEEKLKENWKPRRVVVSCDVCGGEIFHSKKETPAIPRPSFWTKIILQFVKKHHKRVGHDSINVKIDTEPTPVKEIDATITVNE